MQVRKFVLTRLAALHPFLAAAGVLPLGPPLLQPDVHQARVWKAGSGAQLLPLGVVLLLPPLVSQAALLLASGACNSCIAAGLRWARKRRIAACSVQERHHPELPYHPCSLPLQKRAGAKGFGLFAAEDLKSGQFVIEYIGEVLEEEEYLRR